MKDTIGRWRGLPVLVVGDALLDEWRFADPQRLSREAPAPVVTLRERQDAAGGAANTAVNLAALGARPTLVAPLGDDPAAARLRACLRDAGVVDGTCTVPGGVTGTKRRLVADGHILSCEETGPSVPDVEPLLAALDSDPSRILVVCDYGRGALTGAVREWLVTHRDRFDLVALDAHDLGPWTGLEPSLITPSFAEARPFLGSGESDDRLRAALDGAPDMLARTGARLAAVTLDAGGAVVVGTDGGVHRTRAGTASGHTVGAGDTYLATMTLALAAGADPPTAADLAQIAAGIGVTRAGTCRCDAADLLAAVTDGETVDRDTLRTLTDNCRAHGGTVVFTNGCFDVLHRGHVEYLRQARRLGDLLVVAVNSDASVRRLKGPERPVNPAADRAAVLAALSCVDHVVVFEEDSPTDLIAAVRPDVYVKGGDYPPDLIPEAPLVRRLGGQVRTLAYVADRSTTAVIERIRSGAPIPDGRHPVDR